ncbi:MAG: hypothetical protein AAGG09_15235 [Pseudomonadota bacterium]
MTGAAAAPRTLRLHIGAHKTASTHFDALIRANQTLLDAEGVAYLPKMSARRPLMRAIAHGIRGKSIPQDWLDVAAQYDADRCLYVLEEQVIGECHFAGPRAGGLYPHAPERVSVALKLLQAAPEATEILLAVRSPDTFFPSAWCEAQLYRDTAPFLEWMGPARLHQPFWLRLIERIRDAVPEYRLTVWTYESYAAHPAAFLPLVLGQAPGSIAAAAAVDDVVRPGPSAEALDQIARRRAKGRTLDRERVAEILTRFPRGATYPGPTFFSDAERAELRDAYADDLARIGALPGVTLLE